MKGQEVHSIEEFFEGIDGQSPDQWARGFVADVLQQARDEGVEEVTFELRTILAGTTKSSKQFHWHCPVEQHEAHAVVMALKRKAQRQPGDNFGGNLRLFARDRMGGNDGHLGSFSRKMRPAATETPAGSLEGAQGSGSVILMHDAVKPWHDMHMQFMDRVSTLLGGCAQMMSAFHAPVGDGGGNENVAMLQALTGVGMAAMNERGGGRQAPQQIPPPRQPQQLTMRGPDTPHGTASVSTGVLVPGQHLPAGETARALPGPAPGQQPRAASQPTEAQILSWARQNPDRARRLGMQIYTELGPG
jgi:hypothetical protein